MSTVRLLPTHWWMQMEWAVEEEVLEGWGFNPLLDHRLRHLIQLQLVEDEVLVWVWNLLDLFISVLGIVGKMLQGLAEVGLVLLMQRIRNS